MLVLTLFASHFFVLFPSLEVHELAVHAKEDYELFEEALRAQSAHVDDEETQSSVAVHAAACILIENFINVGKVALTVLFRQRSGELVCVLLEGFKQLRTLQLVVFRENFHQIVELRFGVDFGDRSAGDHGEEAVEVSEEDFPPLIHGELLASVGVILARTPLFLLTEVGGSFWELSIVFGLAVGVEGRVGEIALAATTDVVPLLVGVS